MRSIRSASFLLVALTVSTSAFAPSKSSGDCRSLSMLMKNTAEEGNAPVNDRRAFFQAMGLSLAVAAGAASPEPASATYSAYTHREEDWQNRLDKGEVKISSARDLRRQLREIAPMNDEGSKIFCPNGPASAVSPLMENKCGDRMAIPSVYGRTEDTVGNSIPGFSGGRYTNDMPAGGSTSIAAEIGGFPSYK